KVTPLTLVAALIATLRVTAVGSLEVTRLTLYEPAAGLVTPRIVKVPDVTVVQLLLPPRLNVTEVAVELPTSKVQAALNPAPTVAAEATMPKAGSNVTVMLSV